MSVVNVTVPRALTLEQALKVVTGVVAATGHPYCFSGHDIRFSSESGQEFAVDAKTLEIRQAKS
jgi:hypothetical protein